MSVIVLVGNPKAHSRTWQAGQLLAERITGAAPDRIIDLVDFGPALLDWTDAAVAEAVEQVQTSELLVVASPTFKGTFTGLLKLFLDRIGGGSLAAVTAIPLMLGGDWRHSLAPEVFLKPVLAELGASCPTRGLFLLDSEIDASGSPGPVVDPPALTTWLETARPQLAKRLERHS